MRPKTAGTLHNLPDSTSSRRAQREISDKKSQIIISSEVREASGRVETQQFRIPRLLVLNVCKFASFWFLGSKVLATNTLWHPLKLSAALLTFPV